MDDYFDKYNYCDYFVKLYLHDIGSLNVISSEEEQLLFRKYKQGDQSSFHELILKSQYIVIEQVLNFTEKGVELLDLLQEANIALIDSLKRYSNEKGPLKNYLHYNIYRHLENQTPGFYTIIRYPMHTINKLKKRISELNQKKDSLENVDSIDYNYFNNIYSDYSLRDNLNILDRVDIDLDRICNDSVHYPDFQLLVNLLKGKLDSIFLTLTVQESKIIKMYFGLDEKKIMTLEEIGQDFELTRERIRQIKKKAMKKLKHK